MGVGGCGGANAVRACSRMCLYHRRPRYLQETGFKTETTNRGSPTRMLYLYYISCLRYTVLVGNPRNSVLSFFFINEIMKSIARRCVPEPTQQVRTYIHTYMHTYIHTYIHTYLPTYLPTYVPTYLPTYLPTYTHT